MKTLNDCLVLVVDDTPANIDILLEGLGSEPYEVAVAIDGEAALEFVADTVPDLVLLDVMMPGIDGYEVCKQLKENPATAKVPVIFLTALDKVENKSAGFERGGVDYVTKPFEIVEVRARVRTHLELSLSRDALSQQNEILEIKVKERTKELLQAHEMLKETQLETIMRLGLATEMRDDDTGAHVQRIRSTVKFLAMKLGTPEEEAELWGLASTMHDIGKVGIPDAILLKPGKLTFEEFLVIQEHTTIGGKILENPKSNLIRIAHEIAIGHHEKWNGKGYPKGLEKFNVPLAARLTAIADVFDALASKRPYKDPWPLEKIVDLLKNEAGEHFDPRIVETFLDNLDTILEMRESV